nr:hypothetical protein [Tanacetum cinerariifolium]
MIIASLQNELQSNIYKNAKLRTQLFKKVSDQKDNTQDLSANTKFAKQPIVEDLPKIGKTKALSKPVTSNSVPTPQEPKGVNNDMVIAPGMFRISPDKVSREAKKVPNTFSASSRTKPITVSQAPVITKKNVNSDVNGLSSTGLDNTKTRRPQPRSNTKNDRVPSASKSSRSKNKEVKVEEHHRNLLLSKKNKHISSATVRFRNDHVAAILGYGDLKWGNITITKVYFIEELDLIYAPSTIMKQQPSEGELDLLFEAMYDDYFCGQPSATVENVPPAQEPQVRQTSAESTTSVDTVPIPTNSSSHATNIPITSQDVDEL